MFRFRFRLIAVPKGARLFCVQLKSGGCIRNAIAFAYCRRGYSTCAPCPRGVRKILRLSIFLHFFLLPHGGGICVDSFGGIGKNILRC